VYYDMSLTCLLASGPDWIILTKVNQ